jgi:hypothetical protein
MIQNRVAHNEDNDVLEKDERSDDDFISISTDGWEIEEDYWDSADEDDDPYYDPHEYIERRLIMKHKSKKYNPVCDFSDFFWNQWNKCSITIIIQ